MYYYVLPFIYLLVWAAFTHTLCLFYYSCYCGEWADKKYRINDVGVAIVMWLGVAVLKYVGR